jgi:ribonucleoside-triphosphate reductase
LDLAAKTGCNYFCVNVRITICNCCEHIDKRTLTTCSNCGSNDIDYGTRVIGYLKRVSAFSKARRAEHQRRHYHLQSAAAKQQQTTGSSNRAIELQSETTTP